MANKGLEGDELVENLRSLIINFEPHIREAGSADQAEEVLLHLEENDENFHKFEFVKHLKREVDDVLGPLIEDEIEKYTPGGHVDTTGQETLVSKITDRVLQSRQFKENMSKMRKNVTEASQELMNNFDGHFGTGRTTSDTFQSRPSRRPYILTDDEESSYDSSLNQGSLMFLNSDVAQQLADKLSSREVSVQCEALFRLNQFQISDVLGCDHWKRIKESLLEVLGDIDEQLTVLSQKFVTRAFTNTTQKTSDIYELLAEFLKGQFESRRANIPKIKTGLDISRPEIIKLLKAFRLMNEFQQEAPNYWIRFPEKYLEEILDSTVSLCSIHNTGRPGPFSQLTPLHFIAIIDPKAQWFIKWMHASYCRQPLITRLQKQTSMVEDAVRHCLDFSAARKTPFDMLSDISENMSKISVDGKRQSYTGAELEFAYFIHSVYMLGRLLCFVDGQKLFPIRLQYVDEPVTIIKLLKALVLVVVDPSIKFFSVKTASKAYEPGIIVTQILKDLCSSEQVCEKCLCRDEIINTLLSPVNQFLEGEHQIPSDSTLLRVADIFCIFASSAKGRRHLLFGEGKDMFSRTKTSAAHVIAKFTKLALLGQLPRDTASPSHTVIGAYLYLCRQLYNTCDGLWVLYPYELHNVLAESWRAASREADAAHTPTPMDDDSSSSDTSSSNNTKDSYDILMWGDTLRDNLLNFASTAKGILLLQQTGAINECMSYMYYRYEKKLQVSKCEKFGYGYMVTQVAATAPGMVALQNTGYIKAMIAELWSALECGSSDAPLFTPKSWAVEPIERGSHKHLIRVLNVLSAFPAVYEVLYNQPLPVKESYSFREMPDTIVGLLDRLIIVDTPAKIHSLFNNELSHVFGLRVLSVMISCLDSYLLLQSQYGFQDILLAAQANNTREGDRHDIIIDMLSVERNYILVRSYLTGGPSEKTLPPRTLDQSKDQPFSMPLFSSYPIPREYIPNLGKSAMRQDNELMKFLSNKKQVDKGEAWLDKCRPIFTKLLNSKPDQIKGNVIQQLVEQSVTVISCLTEEAIFPLSGKSDTDSSVKNFNLSALQQLGVKMAVRYGIHLKAVHTSSDAIDRLTQLLKQVGAFLKQQQKAVNSPLQFLQGTYPGFDWFSATVFLMCNGNVEKSYNFLCNFSTLAASGYLWPARLHNSIHLPKDLMSSGIPPLFSSTAHNIEFILHSELPLVASAFRISGYTPAQICIHWLKQCFWNYLDWLDIGHYVCTCVVMGIDYQVYLCVAILRHLQRDIRQHMQTADLNIFLKEQPIRGFKISLNMKYMQDLERKYRKIILPDMMNMSKP